jgi:hypothetical protein
MGKNRGLRTSALLLILTLATGAVGQSTTYQVNWYSVDAGGGVSTGGPFSLTGAIGQPDASNPMVGGQFTLTGGYLHEFPLSAEILNWSLY